MEPVAWVSARRLLAGIEGWRRAENRRCGVLGLSRRRRLPHAGLVDSTALYREPMTARADALRSEVLALPEAARARLVIELLDSLDDRPVEADPTELDRVWADETARRARQIDTGEVTTDSWDDVVSKVEQARRAR